MRANEARVIMPAQNTHVEQSNNSSVASGNLLAVRSPLSTSADNLRSPAANPQAQDYVAALAKHQHQDLMMH